MRNIIRFAIIGSGGVAVKHAQAIASISGAKLVVVWGQHTEKGRAFAKEYGAEFEGNLETLAERSDIDAITIATPSGTHESTALPFLRKGKAVLCEKPLEISLEKIFNLLRAAKENNTLLAVILQFRLGHGALAMKKAVLERRFGRLSLCSAYLKWWRDQSYYDAADWRGTIKLDGGGALMNQGIHAVDLLQWLVGMPSKVFAFSGLIAHEKIEVEDTIAVALKFPNGALGVIEAATSCKPGFAMRIELCGEKGSAVLEDDRIVQWQFDSELPGDEALRTSKNSTIVSGSSEPNAIGFEGHRFLIKDFICALQEHRAPLIPGSEAINAVRLILTAYESAQKGLYITL